MSRNDLKAGDEVYVRATVSKVPEDGEQLIRCVTERNEVLWCGEKDLIWRKHKE